MVAVDAASALFNPFYGKAVAQQRAKRPSLLSEAGLRAARASISIQFKKAREEQRQRATFAVKRATPLRLFAARVDADKLIAAARAELDAALRLDARFEFNRAEQRGAQLTLDLAEAAWACRSQRIETAAVRLEAAELKAMRVLWVLPRRRPSGDGQAPQ